MGAYGAQSSGRRSGRSLDVSFEVVSGLDEEDPGGVRGGPSSRTNDPGKPTTIGEVRFEVRFETLRVLHRPPPAPGDDGHRVVEPKAGLLLLAPLVQLTPIKLLVLLVLPVQVALLVLLAPVALLVLLALLVLRALLALLVPVVVLVLLVLRVLLALLVILELLGLLVLLVRPELRVLVVLVVLLAPLVQLVLLRVLLVPSVLLVLLVLPVLVVVLVLLHCLLKFPGRLRRPGSSIGRRPGGPWT